MESSYKVRLSDEGTKRFRKLDKRDSYKIMKKLILLENFKKLNTIKQLSGELKNLWRMRMGKIRVLFEIDEKTKTVWVVEAGFRKEVYR